MQPAAGCLHTYHSYIINIMWHLKKKQNKKHPSWQSIKGVQVSVKLRRHGRQRGRCAGSLGLTAACEHLQTLFLLAEEPGSRSSALDCTRAAAEHVRAKRGCVAMANAREKLPEGRRVYNAVATVAKQCTSRGERALAWS